MQYLGKRVPWGSPPTHNYNIVFHLLIVEKQIGRASWRERV